MPEQALCFLAGANSIFTGEKLLTTPNNDFDADQLMFKVLGLTPKAPSFHEDEADVSEAESCQEAVSHSGWDFTSCKGGAYFQGIICVIALFITFGLQLMHWHLYDCLSSMATLFSFNIDCMYKTN